MDIIIALGMAKEGFDWVWCEHAPTVGYQASLTEIVQIVDRATPEEARDLARRAVKFKQERGRVPSIASPDAWERRMAEGVAQETLRPSLLSVRRPAFSLPGAFDCVGCRGIPA